MSFSDKIIALGAASGFGGAWLWSDRIGGEIVAAVMVMAGLFLTGALAWRAELWEPADLPRPNRSTVRTFALVGLLLGAAIGAPTGPVGTVAADPSYGDCYRASGGSALLDLMGLNSSEIDDITNVDKACGREALENITDSKAYTSGVELHASTDMHLNTVDNSMEDARSVAWAKAKIEIVEAMEQGENASVAKSQAKDAVDEYYTLRQKNLVEKAWANAYAIEDISNSSSVTEYYLSGDNQWADASSVSVADGTWITYADGSGTFPPKINSQAAGASRSVSWLSTESDYRVSFNGSNSGELYQPDNFKARFDEMADQSNQVNNNVDTYVDNVYAEYNEGDLDASDIAESSPTAVASQAATDLNSTGYYGYASAALRSVGVAGPTNTSHIVTLEDGTQIEGTLYVTDTDNFSVSTGETYDPGNFSGSVFITVAELTYENGTAVKGSELASQFHPVQQNFTVESATNTKTGDAVEVTTGEDKDYTSNNASKLKQELEEMQEARAYWQAQATLASGGTGGGSGGGGSSGTSWNLGGQQMLAAVAIGGAALFVLKD